MSLTPFTGIVTAAQLRANFDDKTTTLAANALVGAKDFSEFVTVASLVPSTSLVQRSTLFTPQDDTDLRYLMHHGSADAANRTITTTISVANGDTIYLVDQTISLATVSAGAGTVDGRKDFSVLTGVRVRLLKGVQYQLAIAVDAGTITSAQCLAGMRALRRRR